MLAAASVQKSKESFTFILSLKNIPIKKGMVESLCDHEIGTHLLRMMNEERQKWYLQRNKWGLSEYITTEEGLATLNAMFSIRHNLLLWSSALKYYAVFKGSELSFVELYKELEEYIDDPKLRFRLCARVKRGLSDTSKKGAFSLDQSYFQGALELLQVFHQIDLPLLYAGQISFQDLHLVKDDVRADLCRLPRFLRDSAGLNLYKEFLNDVRQKNGIFPSYIYSFPINYAYAQDNVNNDSYESKNNYVENASNNYCIYCCSYYIYANCYEYQCQCFNVESVMYKGRTYPTDT